MSRRIYKLKSNFKSNWNIWLLLVIFIGTACIFGLLIWYAGSVFKKSIVDGSEIENHYLKLDSLYACIYTRSDSLTLKELSSIRSLLEQRSNFNISNKNNQSGIEDNVKDRSLTSENTNVTNYLLITPENNRTLINDLRSQLDFLRTQQSESLSNLRQEGNNYINRVNGWLGFWIGVMAILMGVVPIAIQVTLNYNTNRRTDKLICKITEKLRSTQMQLLVSSIRIQYDQKIISDDTDGEKLINLIINEVNDCFDELVELLTLFDKNLSQDCAVSIITALLQYDHLLALLVTMYRSKNRDYRRLQNIEDSIKGFLEYILNRKANCDEKVWDELKDLIPQLKSIRYEVPTP